MKFTGRLYEDMAGVADYFKASAADCQLEMQIGEQQRIIQKLTEEIGNLAVLKMEEGAEMAPEIMERYEAIKAAKKQIEELKAEKKATSRECPKCGAKVAVGMKFCGECGSPMNQ